ncbi:hypothetical protein LNTAR_14957 [Lentisphaera araneosa HTCC2155]|uniref:Uncharacterized protein n=1 Tax=Lentisphaera araneosa HTCC2155 TaxID=313628 RepID=A6DHP3_9BACT|nr:hypothetical protein [Lentisphaera araneosa]EDM29126.1 hypothetical protein LNTAR_14957 [Lentisphaera araneosa HTCC2155]
MRIEHYIPLIPPAPSSIWSDAHFESELSEEKLLLPIPPLPIRPYISKDKDDQVYYAELKFFKGEDSTVNAVPISSRIIQMTPELVEHLAHVFEAYEGDI